MRLLSGILHFLDDNMVFDDEFLEAWEIKSNGESMWIGDREKKAIKVVLKRLYRCINGK